MEFSDLLKLCRQGKAGLCVDSRQAREGDIFVAVPGENMDGAKFAPQALQNGAAYVVCSRDAANDPDLGSKAVIVACDDPRKALWMLAEAKFNTLASPMRIIGATGTNGKTTSAYLLEHLLKSAGYSTGVLGTVSYRWPGFNKPAPLTTPGPLELHGMLDEMARAGLDFAIMEVSSHALAQERVGGINFDGALFTNLTQDHLDFHKDMESYYQAKATLFRELPRKDKAMAINIDDPHGARLFREFPFALGFGLREKGGNLLHGEILSFGTSGSRIRMSKGSRQWIINSRLVGEFNVYNLLGVQALALALGMEPDQLQALETFAGVPGRLERVENKRGLNVFVDYAHTPDALENALKALRGAGFKKIITVFGCGGNRDKTKRPLMGQAVARFSDVAVLTSDNPRFEEPMDIINDVLPGLAEARQKLVEADRRKATELALEMLGKNDALLVAGKGHEDYQIINGQKRHYSDQEVVRELLNCA